MCYCFALCVRVNSDHSSHSFTVRLGKSIVTYYGDLEPCTYFGSTLDGKLLAIGWLDADHDVPKGRVAREWVVKLAAAMLAPWQPCSFAGSHECELCRFSGGPGTFCIDGMEISLGATNLFIPTEEFVYVAPSLVLHYIDSHGYAPPQRFLTALEACPQHGTLEYRKLVLRHGLHKLGPVVPSGPA